MMIKAMALAAASAVLAVTPTAVASAAPHAQQRAAGERCVDKVAYSSGRWSSVNYRLCATVVTRAGGAKAVEGSLVGDLSYYWGAAWYNEKCDAAVTSSSHCVVSGALRLTEAGDPTAEPQDIHYFSKDLNGTRHFEVTSTWTVKPGKTYHLDLYKVVKKGGYWVGTVMRGGKRVWDYESSTVELRLYGEGVDISVPR